MCDFLQRLSTSIPSLQQAMVTVGRPARQFGTAFRSACLGKSDDKDSEEAGMRVYTGGKVLYRERLGKEAELQLQHSRSQPGSALNRGPT